MVARRWLIGVSCVLIAWPSLALGQRPGKSAARANAQGAQAERAKPGDEFVGLWRHQLRVRAELTIQRDGDDFAASFRYFDLEGKELGTSHGENFKLSSKSLLFKVIYDKRPEPTWKDGAVAARIDAKGNLQLTALGTGGRDISTYERVGDAPKLEAEKSDVAEASAEDFKVLVALPIKPKPGDVDGAVHHLAALSPRGDCWALYRRKGEVEVRSLPDDRLLQRLTIKGYATFVQFSQDGKTLAVASMGGEERQLGDPRPEPNETAFFLVADGERRALIDHAGVTVTAGTASVSHDGKYFAFTARQPQNKSKLFIWNTETQKRLLDYDDAWRDPGKVAFSADGKKLAFAGKPILVFDIGPGKRREMQSPQLALRCLQLSPDGQLLALGGEGGEIALVNTATGKVAHQFRAYPHTVLGIVFTSGGKLMLTSGGAENAIRAYDRQGKVAAKIPVTSGTVPHMLSVTADGKHLAAWLYGTEQSIHIWSTPWGEK